MNCFAHVTLALALAAMLSACGNTVTPGDGGEAGVSDVAQFTDQSTVVDNGPPRVPMQHRPTAMMCPTDRPAGSCPFTSDAGSAGTCVSDSQCSMGTNGRCVQEVRLASCSCSYDQCNNDSECSMGGPCACRQTTRSARGGNVCLLGNCRTDADCGAGGYCSPSLDFGCGSFVGVTGFYCHTAADACVDDADCEGRDGGGLGGPPFCGYSPAVGHWACASTQCAG
jgi:hypothetical protein